MTLSPTQIGQLDVDDARLLSSHATLAPDVVAMDTAHIAGEEPPIPGGTLGNERPPMTKRLRCARDERVLLGVERLCSILGRHGDAQGT